MADAKISALTGATTPLAGTEEVPLVQSATTKKVTVANLTAGRAVNTGNLQVTGYMAINGTPASYYGLSLGNSTAITGDANPRGITSSAVYGSDATGLVAALFGQIRTTAAAYTMANAAGLRLGNVSKGAGSTVTNQHGVYIEDQTQGTNNYGITSLVSSGTNKWNLYASGTANNYMAGNLAFASGKGIDFSATSDASGMTSELLADYEEGTWTPTVSGGSGTTYTTQNGWYRKVGNLVVAGFELTINSEGTISGGAAIAGIPYTSGATYKASGSLSYSTGQETSTVWQGLTIGASQSVFTINIRTAASASTTSINGADFFANGTQIIGTISYHV